MAIKSPQFDLAARSFAGAALDGLAGEITDSEYFAANEGALSVTLDNISTAAAQLPLLLTSGTTSTAYGTVTGVGGGDISGSLSVTLDGVTLSASGTVPRTGTLAATLADVTLTAEGDVPRVGSLTATLAAVTSTATGTVRVAGTLTQTLADVTATATGGVRVSGSLSATLGALALSGTGTVTNGPTGALSVTLDDVTAAGAGTVTGEGTPDTGFEITGGYLAEARRQRRRKKKPPGAPPSTEAQAGPGLPDATPEAPAADLELVRQLVAYWTGEADRELLNRRAQRALDYALRAQTVLAMQLFERELARQMEEDDITAVLMILADD